MNRFLRIVGFSIAVCVLLQWLVVVLVMVMPFAANIFLGFGVEIPRWFTTNPRVFAAFLFFLLFSPGVVAVLIIGAIIYFFRRRKNLRVSAPPR